MSAVEFHTQRAIVELLDAAYPEVLYFSVPNGAVLGWSDDERARAKREWSKLRFLGAKTGVADLILLTRYGKPIALEVKSPTGKLSPEQVEWKMEWTRHEGLYAVVRSQDDVIAALAGWGIKGRIAACPPPATTARMRPARPTPGRQSARPRRSASTARA